ncbi:hypothetical protein PSHT_03886 [Puccinia striiformis]|uniref:Uncharacterized protein n=1 Tax=Puccinia striiformis TaxID=27350 RepID=A0A2S4WE98_9BASI|nr:hypothetical protein PSHT_03886 [Puccinia striiformis]
MFRTPSGIKSAESQPPSPCLTTDRSHHPAPQDPETNYNEVFHHHRRSLLDCFCFTAWRNECHA